MSGHSKWSTIKHKKAAKDAKRGKLFTKHGGSMGEAGCVGWMFHKRGVLTVDRQGVDEDRLMEIALEAGADDVAEDGGAYQITTPPDAFEAVKGALEKAKITVATGAVSMVPQNTLSLTGGPAENTLKLLDELEDHDDVQEVASNIDISQEELERLSAA